MTLPFGPRTLPWAGVGRAVGAFHQRPQGPRICPHEDAHLPPRGHCPHGATHLRLKGNAKAAQGKAMGFLAAKETKPSRGGLSPTATASQPSHKSEKTATNPPGAWAHHHPIRGAPGRRAGPPATIRLGAFHNGKDSPKGCVSRTGKNGIWSALITKKALSSSFNSRFLSLSTQGRAGAGLARDPAGGACPADAPGGGASASSGPA